MLSYSWKFVQFLYVISAGIGSIAIFLRRLLSWNKGTILLQVDDVTSVLNKLKEIGDVREHILEVSVIVRLCVST